MRNDGILEGWNDGEKTGYSRQETASGMMANKKKEKAITKARRYEDTKENTKEEGFI
jgi:hypothetical protein